MRGLAEPHNEGRAQRHEEPGTVWTGEAVQDPRHGHDGHDLLGELRHATAQTRHRRLPTPSKLWFMFA